MCSNYKQATLNKASSCQKKILVNMYHVCGYKIKVYKIIEFSKHYHKQFTGRSIKACFRTVLELDTQIPILRYVYSICCLPIRNISMRLLSTIVQNISVIENNTQLY